MAQHWPRFLLVGTASTSLFSVLQTSFNISLISAYCKFKEKAQVPFATSITTTIRQLRHKKRDGCMLIVRSWGIIQQIKGSWLTVLSTRAWYILVVMRVKSWGKTNSPAQRWAYSRLPYIHFYLFKMISISEICIFNHLCKDNVTNRTWSRPNEF